MSFPPVYRHRYHDYYKLAKSAYMALGREYEKGFAVEVGGELARRDQTGDVWTDLGAWEFAAAANTKNSAGDGHDHGRVPDGHCVQVTGRPRPGWISAATFLELHGFPADEAEQIACDVAAEAQRAVDAQGEQLWICNCGART